MASPERRAYLAWTRAAGPFWQYVAAPPFFGCLTRRPRPGPLAAARRTVEQAILPLVDTASGRAALLLDLPPNLGLATALVFQDAGWLVVPVIMRWPARRAVLPSDGILAQLVWLAPRLARTVDPVGVVFVLDGARTGPKRPAGLRRRFDNRYDYSLHPFPPAQTLQTWGVGSVAVAGRERRLAADLVPLTGTFRTAGLAVSQIWVMSDE